MRYFYICYSPQEDGFAQQLADLLKQAFKNATIELSEQKFSTDDLLAKIDRCEVFIYLISPPALGSGRWEAQVQEAIRLGKAMQPIQVRSTKNLFALPGRFAPIDMTRGITKETSPALLDALSRLQQTEIQLRPPNRVPIFVVMIIVISFAALGAGFLLKNGNDSDHVERLVEKTVTQTVFATQVALAVSPSSPTVTATSSRTLATETPEPTNTITPSPTSSPSITSSPSSTKVYTVAPSLTPTLTATLTRTSTQSATAHPSNTLNPRPTMTHGATTSRTPTQTATSSPTNTPWPSRTSTATSTPLPTRTRTFTPIPSPTRTPTFTPSLTLIPTNTLPPSNTPTLTFTPVPTLTPTIDVQTIVCDLAPKTRLQINQSARIIYPEGVRLREMPGFSGAILDMVAAGAIVQTISVPVCRDDILWWEVKLDSGQTGWVAEGQPDLYYLEPVES
ncbi:MAG: SH3 domain-containing protein [Chloroflexi bacterium]|nr:SH3 domain-containing protein [Chloroflexota bacterium]